MTKQQLLRQMFLDGISPKELDFPHWIKWIKDSSGKIMRGELLIAGLSGAGIHIAKCGKDTISIHRKGSSVEMSMDEVGELLSMAQNGEQK